VNFDEKLKLCRASYDAFNGSDLEKLFELYDAECEWQMSNFDGWPESLYYRGREGLKDFFDAWLAPWEDFDAVITKAIDLPDDRVFIIGHISGRGRLSGALVELPPIAQIIEFRNGRFLRVDNYSDLETGRKAAGLAEEGTQDHGGGAAPA
jgi:ketosteroid isomerase-like protein